MPIIRVEMVLAEAEVPAAGLAQAIATAAGTIFESLAGHTWATVRAIPARDYAENGGGATQRPVFVSVLKRDAPAALEREIQQLTQAIARICNRSAEDVHIMYEPPARGRIAFGGELVT